MSLCRRYLDVVRARALKNRLGHADLMPASRSVAVIVASSAVY